MNRNRIPISLENLSQSRIVSSSLTFLIFWQCMTLPAFAATRIHNEAATPATIMFIASDPDLPTPGSVSATIDFRTTGGRNDRNWRVDMQATSGPNMTNCPNTIPISEVLVTCTSAVSDNGGTASCAAPFALSGSTTTIACGLEGKGNASPYQVVLNFEFQDSWQYIDTGSACAVNLSYQIFAE